MSTKPIHDDRPPPSPGKVLFDVAMRYAKQAVALDKEKRYDAAIPKYTRAAEALVDFMKTNKNPKLQQACAEKVQEYAHRAKFLWSGLQQKTARVTPVHEPPASCKGCRFYDQYRDDCRSVMFRLVKEHRDENLHCPSKEASTGLACPGG